MSQVQTNIVLGGRGRIQGVVVEMLLRLVFHNFLKVSQGRLASIVAIKEGVSFGTFII